MAHVTGQWRNHEPSPPPLCSMNLEKNGPGQVPEERLDDDAVGGVVAAVLLVGLDHQNVAGRPRDALQAGTSRDMVS